jgi:GTPase
MVLVSPALKPTSCVEFEADIYVLYHNKFICRGFQTVVHVGNVRQTAIIVKMSKVSVVNREYTVVLKFQSHLLTVDFRSTFAVCIVYGS